MRIALVSGSYPPARCGIGDYAAAFARHLVQSGHEVGVVTSAAAQADSADMDGIKFHPVVVRWNSSGVGVASAQIAALQPELVHIQYPGLWYGRRPEPARLPARIRLRDSAVPVVATIHEYRIAHPVRKWIVRRLARQLDHVFLTDAREEKALSADMRNACPPVTISPVAPLITPETSDDFVREDRRDLTRSRYGLPPTAPVMVHFGYAQPNKGVDVVLQAFSILTKSVPEARLLMVCSFQSGRSRYREELMRLQARLGIERSVVWTGFLESAEVSDALNCADATVMPFIDGVSDRRTSFASTLQHGLPTVTTTVGNAAAHMGIRDGESALLVPAPATATALADAMKRLIGDDGLRSRLRTGARAAGKRWSWAATMEAVDSVYRRLHAAGDRR